MQDSTIQLLDAATSTNGAPSGSAAGVAWNRHWDDAMIAAASTAGSGTMTAKVRLWGYIAGELADWFPIGPADASASDSDADKGVLNLGQTLGETGADSIRHTELLTGLSGFSRLYAEVTAIAGTDTAVSLWAIKRSRAV